MSMALVLEHTQEWFRAKYGWTPNQCGVQFNAQPTLSAGQFYVAIEDAGVESGNDSTDSLKEIINLSIGVWRRPEHLRNDLRGNLKLPMDKYLLGSWTLHDLERAVLLHRTLGDKSLHGLHGNWGFRTAINTRYNLPDPDHGAEFSGVFMYRGKGPMETLGLDDGNNVHTWFGYRLRFRGLWREQKFRIATDAIG